MQTNRLKEEKLAQYEDLGLTPEQIREVDRLYAEKCKEVAEYQKKIEDGRLIELPCKVGDTVYLISNPINVTNYENDEDDETLKIFDCKISSITFYNTSNQIRLCWDGEFVAYYLSTEDIGRVVFLTHEEAEQALQRMKGE